MKKVCSKWKLVWMNQKKLCSKWKIVWILFMVHNHFQFISIPLPFHLHSIYVPLSFLIYFHSISISYPFCYHSIDCQSLCLMHLDTHEHVYYVPYVIPRKAYVRVARATRARIPRLRMADKAAACLSKTCYVLHT
jgi:superoxide dismutase